MTSTNLSNIINHNYFKRFSFVLICTLPLLLLYGNGLKLWNYCIHAIDFGIYQEAIYKLSKFKEWNPYINIRDIHIFNDHFDPIIFIPAVIISLLGERAEWLLVFEWLIFPIMLGILFLKFKNDIQRFLLLSLFFIFSKGLLSGIEFPIHPTTWSYIPCFFIANAIAKRNFKSMIMWTNISCLFKEFFPFAMFTLSFVFIFEKQYKKFLLMFANSIVWIVFDFLIRPKLIEAHTMGYGAQLIGGFFHDPISFAIRIIRDFKYFDFIKVYSFLILAVYFIVKKKKEYQQDMLTCLYALIFISPILIIQFISGNFHYQYGAPFAGLLLGLLASLNYEVTNRLYVLAFISFFTVSGIYTKSVNLIFNQAKKQCVVSNYAPIADPLSNNEIKGNILATGGIVPLIMKSDRKIFQPWVFSAKQDNYQIFAINLTGDYYPQNKQVHLDILEKCFEQKFIDQKFAIIENPNIANCNLLTR